MSWSLIKLESAGQRNAILAALTDYTNNGGGDPAARPIEIDLIARGELEGLVQDVSLDEADLDALIVKIQTGAKPTVELIEKNNYGTVAYYPHNCHAARFAELLGTKTIPLQHTSTIKALGFEVRVLGTNERIL
jgi:hypothetical protein